MKKGHGLDAMMGNFPAHMPDPFPRGPVRKFPVEGEVKDSFKVGHPRRQHNPMPSVPVAFNSSFHVCAVWLEVVEGAVWIVSLGSIFRILFFLESSVLCQMSNVRCPESFAFCPLSVAVCPLSRFFFFLLSFALFLVVSPCICLLVWRLASLASGQPCSNFLWLTSRRVSHQNTIGCCAS